MLKSRFFCADHELQILHVHVHVLFLRNGQCLAMLDTG